MSPEVRKELCSRLFVARLASEEFSAMALELAGLAESGATGLDLADAIGQWKAATREYLNGLAALAGIVDGVEPEEGPKPAPPPEILEKPEVRLGSNWAFDFEESAGTIEVTVRVGEPGLRALVAGKLILTPDEADELRLSLGGGALVTLTEDFL